MTPVRTAALLALLAGTWCSTAMAVSPEDPEVKALIREAAGNLRAKLTGGNLADNGYDSLCGYAVLKADVPPTDPAVTWVLGRVRGRVANGVYKPGGNGNYTAGCDLMFLEALHDESLKPEMQAIVAYLAQARTSDGAWHYPGTPVGGDQSITQYAVLGLWAAERAEVQVPPALWDGLANWQVRVQKPDGGFAYHPATDNQTTNTMTCAGISNLLVVRKYLYRAADLRAQKLEERKKEEPKKRARFGVLKRVEADDVATRAAANEQEEAPEDEPETPLNYTPRTPRAAVEGAVKRAGPWMQTTVPRAVRGNGGMESHEFYLWYGIERMAALANVKVIGGVDWYDAGANFFARRKKDWINGRSETAFGILFLSQATGKILGRKPKPAGIDVGSGLLAGGRGLPEDLSQVVEVSDGKAETRKSTEPLDELFAALGDPATGQQVEAQQAIVEKLRLGDREELIGQIDKVLEFVEHPHREIRRTGVWVLGRTEDLRYVDKLVDALEDDSLDVAVEARNALCFMARKPRGMGMPDDPFAAVPEGATEAQRTAAAKEWQREARSRWTKWAAEKRPYDERDRVSQIRPEDGEDE